MANIKDIAKMAGVSVTTVSRVINNQPYVSAEKSAAVWKAIEASNYQKNINAVHLSKGKTHLIGVAIPYSNHPYFGLLIEGIAHEAIKNNYKIVLFQTNYEQDRELEALNMLRLKQIDALIICSRICEWDVIEGYTADGSVILCEDTRGRKISSTFVDHYKTFVLGLEYLYNKGHKNIGYCIGRQTGTNSRQREQAYRDFLVKINEPLCHDYVFHDCLNFEDGEQIVARIKKMSSPPSALLVANDQVAAGIATCCNEQNISIPDELALVGFDNQPIAKIMHITTIEIPLVDVGRKLFLQALKPTTFQEEIPVKLIERETV